MTKVLTMFRCALNPISRLIVDFQGRYARSIMFIYNSNGWISFQR